MKRQGHVKMVSLEHGKKRKKTPMTLQPYFSPSPNQRVKDYVFGSQEKIQLTWKAEEAVPNTNPFGKLPLLISAKHIWISKATTTRITRPMPLLLIIIVFIASSVRIKRGR